MMNTGFRQIQHIVTLGRLLSFTKAANELGITQPVLTRSIQAIEERAKVRLFDRDCGKVRLTEVGKAYLERATALLQEANDLDRLVQQAAAGKAGEVMLGTTPQFNWGLMRNVLTRELADPSQLRITIVIRSPLRLAELVRSEKIEFCICPEIPVLPDTLRTTFIGTYPLSLVVRAGHPLLDGFEHLEPREFPLLLSGPMLRGWRVPEILKPFLTSSPKISTEDIGVLTHLTANSDAVWLSSSYVVSDEIQKGILQELTLPNCPEMNVRVFNYSHNRRTLSPAAKHLSALIRAEMARLAG